NTTAAAASPSTTARTTKGPPRFCATDYLLLPGLVPGLLVRQRPGLGVAPSARPTAGFWVIGLERLALHDRFALEGEVGVAGDVAVGARGADRQRLAQHP